MHGTPALGAESLATTMSSAPYPAFAKQVSAGAGAGSPAPLSGSSAAFNPGVACRGFTLTLVHKCAYSEKWDSSGMREGWRKSQKASRRFCRCRHVGGGSLRAHGGTSPAEDEERWITLGMAATGDLLSLSGPGGRRLCG